MLSSYANFQATLPPRGASEMICCCRCYT